MPGLSTSAISAIIAGVGEAVKAFVVLRHGEEVSKETLIDHCRERLAKYKVPVDIEFRDALPKNNIGKVLKNELREKQTTGR